MSECPCCHQPFTCQLAREAHMKLQPNHFAKDAVPVAVAECGVDEPKIIRRKTNNE